MKNSEKASWFIESIEYREENIRHIDGIRLGKGLFYNKERQYIRYDDSIIKFDKTKCSLFIKFLCENAWKYHSSIQILDSIYNRSSSLSMRRTNTQAYVIYAKLINTKKYKFLKKFIKKETRKKEKWKWNSFTYYKLETI